MDLGNVTPKPAFLTTEFWLTVIPVILFLYKAFTGKDVEGIDIGGLALLAASVATGLYAIARALTKRAAALANAQIATAKLSIAHDDKLQRIAREDEVGKTRERFIGELQTYRSQIEELEEQVEQVRGLVPRTSKGTIDTRTAVGKKAAALGLR